MAISSTLSPPTLYTLPDLQSNPNLTTKITNLINTAFARSKKPDPIKWGKNPKTRFPTHASYFDMLGSEGIVALLYDEDTAERKVVATAAAIPWQGGWKHEGAGDEEGWEIKAVAVDEDARYLRRGLAVQLYAFLEQCLVLKAKELGVSTTGQRFGQTDRLTIWILAAECINGAYWRRKGYEVVRREAVEAPTWGVLTGFEMVVLRKDVEFEFPGIDDTTDSATGIGALGRQGMEVR
ncbi:hypothetical protein OPT61_g2361 [Boeremia exigua]|uniref:Uncharacterized protein n=1 Tax=Boeremia exigua TaxID=749465 RepID=A0ACC2ILW7_9PLEO|nr:hypothetical protein OPT61_g2361 [Boeremia exigua]